MGSNDYKTKFSIRVDTDLLEQVSEYAKSTDALSRTELIENALRFYLGYLKSQKVEDYLLQSLSSVLTSTVHDSENRLARMDFKIAVELSKLSHVIAYTHNVDEESMEKLHFKCLNEVKSINGTVNFEDAYRFQKRKN